ncbi:hypothetical protein N7451_006517 [Penicillium sp. IBT 35674x]|nr:hypothetical protein N7451_006517 [Penicillium sp. IBT 35674x]
MALVVDRFGIVFTFGRMLGVALNSVAIVTANPFVTADLVSFVLNLLKTIYLWAYLPETHQGSLHWNMWRRQSPRRIWRPVRSTPPKSTNNPAIISNIYFLYSIASVQAGIFPTFPGRNPTYRPDTHESRCFK